MEFGTGIPFTILINGIAQDMATYSNVFIVKSRVDKIANSIQAKGVLDTKPVGGYFRADPTTVTIKQDSSGTIAGYQQTVSDTTKTFKSTDVVQMYADKNAGDLFGTPRVSTALEDVKMLRKLEGTVFSLVYRFAAPLYQMKVGLPQAGLMATAKELKEAEKSVQEMSLDGMIITNERTSFNVLGADGEVIDLKPYLEYYENRVFSALNLSQAMMGRGGSKQDADTMETQVHDQVKYFQQTIEVFIENSMFNELLLEGGFNPIFNEEDRVTFKFNEISLDTKVKLENHILALWQSNAVSFQEMRLALGYLSNDVDTSQLYANMITQTNAMQLLDAKLGVTSNTEVNNRNTNKRILNGKNPTSAKDNNNGTVANKNTPENQYGKSSVKISESLNPQQDLNKKNYQNKYPLIYKKYNALRNKLIKNKELDKKDYESSWDNIRTNLKQYSLESAKNGILTFNLAKTGKLQSNDSYSIDLKEINDLIDVSVDKIKDDVYNRLKENKDTSYYKTVMDTLEYRVRFMCEYIVMKSYWYSYAKIAQHSGLTKVYVHFNSEEHRKLYKTIVALRNFKLEQIPPFNPYCRCKLSINDNNSI